MSQPIKCPYTIKEIIDKWENGGKQNVQEGHVYLVPTKDIIDNKHYKLIRTENNALAPGKIKNNTAEDIAAGKENYRKTKESIQRDGFDPLRPMSFLVRKHAGKQTLHQGHHRLGIALELKLDSVPVIFIFDREC